MKQQPEPEHVSAILVTEKTEPVVTWHNKLKGK